MMKFFVHVLNLHLMLNVFVEPSWEKKYEMSSLLSVDQEQRILLLFIVY